MVRLVQKTLRNNANLHEFSNSYFMLSLDVELGCMCLIKSDWSRQLKYVHKERLISMFFFNFFMPFRKTQNMKMHLCTAFRVSTSFYSSGILHFQGAVQGNGAVPALWLIISIFLIRQMHHCKAVSSLSLPISNITQLLAALMHAQICMCSIKVLQTPQP